MFIVGPNASGKSNLLDVFRFLHDIVSVGGGLEEAARKRQGILKLRALAARRFPDIVIRVDLGGGNGDTWQYELALGHDKQHRPQIKRESVLRNSEVLVSRPDGSDINDPERLTQTYLQQVWAILEGGGPLLLEEPELSLHPEVVRFLPQMFARMQRRSGRQMIVSTHSVELLRDEGIGLDEVLLLTPSPEGTRVGAAEQFPEIRTLLEGGSTLSEAVMPLTRPKQVEQLALFGD